MGKGSELGMLPSPTHPNPSDPYTLGIEFTIPLGLKSRLVGDKVINLVLANWFRWWILTPFYK
jgi:hypothetical protein